MALLGFVYATQAGKHWQIARFEWLSLGKRNPNLRPNKTPVDRPGFFKKRRMRAFLFLIFNFFQDDRQAFKLKMATNFSVQNDRQLFIYSYPTSKFSHISMYFVKPNCLRMFPSIAFSLQHN